MVCQSTHIHPHALPTLPKPLELQDVVTYTGIIKACGRRIQWQVDCPGSMLESAWVHVSPPSCAELCWAVSQAALEVLDHMQGKGRAIE